ncbi:MAG: tRNA (guanosine(37)-N1)-methyltransferase TrmD [Thermodesulfobacteriota bacterium]
MRFDILTLFPHFFVSPLECSILKRAIDKGLIEINTHNIRNYALDKHKTVDDSPYGGGDGMVLKAGPVFRAVEKVKALERKDSTTPTVILLTPQGRLFNQGLAMELSGLKNIILICGRYQGVDERIRGLLVDEEISIGDYVLSGGETPAMVLIEAVTRLIPGVLGSEISAREDSFSMGLLEHPHYTRPEVFMDIKVPDILLSGNHGRIDRWRRREAIKRTLDRRPELLEATTLTEEDIKIIEDIKKENGGNYEPDR